MALKDLECYDKSKLCYNNNTALKAAGVTIPMTKEQQDEIIRCRNDIIYFTENYVKIATNDDGIQNFILHEYQKEWIRTCADNRFVMGKWSRQSGKCVSGDTMVTVRNKRSGEVVTLPIADLFALATPRPTSSATQDDTSAYCDKGEAVHQP